MSLPKHENFLRVCSMLGVEPLRAAQLAIELSALHRQPKMLSPVDAAEMLISLAGLAQHAAQMIAAHEGERGAAQLRRAEALVRIAASAWAHKPLPPIHRGEAEPAPTR